MAKGNYISLQRVITESISEGRYSLINNFVFILSECVHSILVYISIIYCGMSSPALLLSQRTIIEKEWNLTFQWITFWRSTDHVIDLVGNLISLINHFLPKLLIHGRYIASSPVSAKGEALSNFAWYLLGVPTTIKTVLSW